MEKRYNNTMLFRVESEIPPTVQIPITSQRKKGRDLFDLYIALQRKEVDVDKVLQCYRKYMEFVVDKAPSYKQFVNNMQEKMVDAEFINDTQSLLRPGISFNAKDAYPLIYETFIDKMEGKRD